jgi:hypothetical protein
VGVVDQDIGGLEGYAYWGASRDLVVEGGVEQGLDAAVGIVQMVNGLMEFSLCSRIEGL